MKTKVQQLITQKPLNKNKFQFVNPFTNKKIIIDSQFESGNLKNASITFLSKKNIKIQIMGNTDMLYDYFAKYWFYFRISGEYQLLNATIILKNANCYRKYFRQKKYLPAIVYKSQLTDWQSIQQDLIIENLDNDQIIVNFNIILLKSQSYYFAMNYPYTLKNLQQYLNNLKCKNDSIYLNKQILCKSAQKNDVHLLTITSSSNILSFDSKQQKYCQNPQMFPQENNRPYKLKKNKPIIFFTGRAHPSQIAASYFIQGIINFLMDQKDIKAQIFRKMFIVCVVPIINPDGVANGNYRSDNFGRNLNRFYGYSSFQQTPTVKSIQIILQKYLQQEDLLMYFDVHGHSSPKSSFIFGNYTKNIIHHVENRVFTKILQKSMKNFKYNQCQFSLENMDIKEKYDQYSKLSSGRAFVGYNNNGWTIENRVNSIRSSSNSNTNTNGNNNANTKNNLNNNKTIPHSYTLQICPFNPLDWANRISSQKSFPTNQNYLNNNINESLKKRYKKDYDYRKIIKNQGYELMAGILTLFQLNPQSDSNNVHSLRKITFKQIINNHTQIYERNSLIIRYRKKDINDDIVNQYINRWFDIDQCQKCIKNQNLGFWKEIAKQKKLRLASCQTHKVQFKKHTLGLKDIQHNSVVNKIQKNINRKNIVVLKYQKLEVNLEQQSQKKLKIEDSQQQLRYKEVNNEQIALQTMRLLKFTQIPPRSINLPKLQNLSISTKTQHDVPNEENNNNILNEQLLIENTQRHYSLKTQETQKQEKNSLKVEIQQMIKRITRQKVKEKYQTISYVNSIASQNRLKIDNTPKKYFKYRQLQRNSQKKCKKEPEYKLVDKGRLQTFNNEVGDVFKIKSSHLLLLTNMDKKNSKQFKDIFQTRKKHEQKQILPIIPQILKTNSHKNNF